LILEEKYNVEVLDILELAVDKGVKAFKHKSWL